MWATCIFTVTKKGGAIFLRIFIYCAFQSWQFAKVTFTTIVITYSGLLFKSHGLDLYWLLIYLISGQYSPQCAFLSSIFGIFDDCIINFAEQDPSCIDSCIKRFMRDIGCLCTRSWWSIYYVRWLVCWKKGKQLIILIPEDLILQ